MIIVVKIILIAFAVFGQAKLFPESAASTASSLDSVALPAEKPELVLAQRAMQAQGLCRAGAEKPAWAVKPTVAAARDSATVQDRTEDSKLDVATNCF